ncbi:MAG: hypothetical protein WCO86_15730 [Planctomycetota bacterium]
MSKSQPTTGESSREPGEMPDPKACSQPDPSQTYAVPTGSDEETSGEKTIEMLEHFPKEIAALLMMAGVAGLIMPGPIGAPLLIAGGVIIWPKTFRPIGLWFSRKFPNAHREGVIQIKEFVRDLNKRYPES